MAILFLTYKIFQAMGNRMVTGPSAVIDRIGVAKSEVSPSGGIVFINGEWWNARSESPVMAGDRVRILSVDDMVLTVAVDKE